jgi:hypothetical protein
MRITINDVIAIEPCAEYTLENVFFSMQVKESFGGRESVTAKDIATAPMISLRGRARLLSHLLGPRDVKREVARRIARDALGDREIPALYRAWLDTGDEAKRLVARDIAGGIARGIVRDIIRDIACRGRTSDAACWGAAWGATGDHARDAAHSAACTAAWDIVQDKMQDKVLYAYVDWMAEWLDSHE